MSQMTTDALRDLMAAAGLDSAADQVMQATVDTLGPAITAAMGKLTIDDITTAEVVLVTMLVDDSSSIRFAGNADAIRQGHNGVLDSLKGAKQSASVLVSCQYLNNGTVLYPYVALADAVYMDAHNYDPRGGTPLYDRTVQVLTGVAVKVAEFEQGGVAVRSITVIVTDGADYGSYRETAASVKKVVNGMLKQENAIIAGIGVSDDVGTNFQRVFEEMGIRTEWILTPDKSAKEIRAAFMVFSQSAVQASQTAGSFSQTALGGFGA